MDAQIFAGLAALAIGSSLVVPILRPDWIVRVPKLVLLIVAAVSLLAGAQLYRPDLQGFQLEIDPSTEPLLPRNDPAKDLYESAVLDFGDDEIFVIALECEEVFSVECLGTIDRATNRIARLDRVRSVSSLLEVTSFRWVEKEEWVEVRPFIEEVPSEPEQLAELRARALSDPVYRRTIVSEDSRAAAINVSFRKMSDREFIESGLDAELIEIVRDELRGGQRFYVAGRPHVKVHVYEGLVHDLRRLIPLGAGVMALVIFLLTGAKRMVFLPILTALIATLWTFAAMSVTGKPLTLLSGLLAPMLLAIGSVYGIHVVSRYEEDAAEQPDSEAAALHALRHLIVPVIIAGLTTVTGFGALLVTDVPAVFELGLFSMLGVSSVTVLSLTAIPAALVLFPLRTGAQHLDAAQANTIGGRIAGVSDRLMSRFLDLLSGLVARHSGPIIVLAGFLALVSAAAIPRIVIDTDYLSYFDESDPVRRDFEAVNRLLAGAVPIYVVLEGREPGVFREPVVLQAMEDLQSRLDALPGVSRTLSSVDSMRILNRAMAADDPAAERIPETRPAVSELLFMMPKSDLSRYTTVNHGRANLIVRTGEVGSAAIKNLTAQIEAELAATEFGPDVTSVGVTGNTILLSRSADGIARGQPLSVALAAVAIFFLITLGMRSARLGLVAMIPNLLPVLMFFGLLGLGAAPLSLPTSLIGCIALGVAIDDSVHFMVRYRRERERGDSARQAAATCGRAIGRPIAITSVVISLGFVAVAFSDFATLREFGLLSAATMLICFFNDVVLLPALLLRARI